MKLKIPKTTAHKKLPNFQKLQKIIKNTLRLFQNKFPFKSIRTKLIMGFLIPLLCLVIIGIVSYHQAANGLIKNYEASTADSLDMTATYLDYGFQSITANGIQLSSDNSISNYLKGDYDEDSTQKLTIPPALHGMIKTKNSVEKFIHNIHVIPKAGKSVFSSSFTQYYYSEGFYDEIFAEEELLNKAKYTSFFWTTSHNIIDEKLGLEPLDRAFSYNIMMNSMTSANGALVVVDVSADAVCDVLKKLEFKEGSKVAFITSDGKEISPSLLPLKREDKIALTEYETAVTALETARAEAENKGEPFEETEVKEYIPMDFTLSLNPKDISHYDFYSSLEYQNFKNSEETLTTQYIKIKGNSYLLMLKKCNPNLSGGIVALLVPKTAVTESADKIKALTIPIIIGACLITVLIGYLITLGITKSMNSIIKKLDFMSKGDLTVTMEGDIRTELGLLSSHIQTSVLNTRRLISKVSNTTTKVSATSNSLNKVVDSVTGAFHTIHQIMNEINSGIENQAEDAQVCNSKMEDLSGSIQEVTTNMESISLHMDSAKSVVSQGLLEMNQLKINSSKTSEITQIIVEDILVMNNKIKDISDITDMICTIAEQTKLLSLNASIEAARAGVYGRGFSVVADEIGKLAEHSSKSVNSIQEIVSQITAHSLQTVKQAKQAEDIVNNQEKKVGHTIDSFENINTLFIRLIENIKIIKENVLKMDEKRYETLSQIENIAAVSEEAVASSNIVNDTVVKQFESMEQLLAVYDELKGNTSELESYINQFKI